MGNILKQIISISATYSMMGLYWLAGEEDIRLKGGENQRIVF